MLAMTGCTPIGGSSSQSGTGSQSSTISEAKPVDVVFEGKTVLYDGKVHSLEIQGTLPEGVTVTYSSNNAQVNVGVYEITAEFSDTEGNLYQSKTAVLRISDSINDMWDNLRFQGQKTSFVYDGNPHSLIVDPNSIPDGYEVSRYTGNGQTIVGEYNVTVYMRNTVSKVEVYNRTTVMKIVKADIDMTNVIFESKEFAYDGKAHSLAVEGLDDSLPLLVSYDNNSLTDKGSIQVTANFKSTDSNYNDPKPITRTLTVTDASESVTVNIFAYYQGSLATVMGSDGTVVQTNDTAYKVSLPVGGTLTEDMLPVLAFQDEHGTWKAAPKGAYSVDYDESSVKDVKKQAEAINLSVTYSAKSYTITYAYTNSSKAAGEEKIRYTFDEQITLPTPNMDPGYEFQGWSYETDYDQNSDDHYKGDTSATDFSKGNVSTSGIIPARTFTGNVHLTVKSHEIGAESKIVDTEKVYNGRADDITIVNKNETYVNVLTYYSEGGYALSSTPKEVGTYKVTLEVFTDKTKTTEAQPKQTAIFTIKKASLNVFATNSSGQIVVYDENDNTLTPIKDLSGNTVSSIFGTTTDADTSYDMSKNVYTYTYDGKQKEVMIKIIGTDNVIYPLASGGQQNYVPFIPHISYRNVTNGVIGDSTNEAPTNAGTYEVTVTFTNLNSDSSNYNTIPSMKCTLIINKKNVNAEIKAAQEASVTKNGHNLWRTDEAGVSYADNGDNNPKYTFTYEEGKMHEVYFDITAIDSFPSCVAIDHYSNEKTSTVGDKTATVYFKVTDSNYEVPDPVTCLYKIASDTVAVTFYDENNLSTYVASYSVVKGTASPLPTSRGDDTNNLGYDVYYYLKNENYDAANQTGDDATSQLVSVKGEKIDVVIVRKLHIYNIKYIISDLADNSMNLSTYSIVDDSDKTLKAPTLQNATFKGWYLDPNFSTSVVTVGTRYNKILDSKKYADLILYAKFESKTPTVYFYLSEDAMTDGVIGSGNYYSSVINTFEEKYIFPQTNPTREGRTFKNWYIIKDGEKVIINSITTVELTTDHAAYAEWYNETYRITVTYKTKKDEATYEWIEKADTFTIEYNSNLTAATNINTLSTIQNLTQLAEKVSSDATSMGYTFEGFFYTNGQAVDIDEDKFAYTNDQQIVAKLTASKIKVNYNFLYVDDNKISGPTSLPNLSDKKISNTISLYSTTDQVLTLPSAEQLSKSGYSIATMGYLVYSGDDVTRNTAVFNVDRNITSASILTPDLRNAILENYNGELQINIGIQYFLTTYTITFVDEDGRLCDGNNNTPIVGSNGASIVKYKSNAEYSTPSLSGIAKYYGYEFDCWEYEGNSYSGQMVYEFTKDITVKLKVKAKNAKVRFYTDENEVYTELENVYTKKIGDYYTIPSSTPQKTGETFVGWVTKSKYDEIKNRYSKAMNYAYLWGKRDDTTNIATKYTYYTDNDYITNVTPVEQTDYLNEDDAYNLYAIFIKNEYSINVEYTYLDTTTDADVTRIASAEAFIWQTEDGLTANNGSWDKYIYIKNSAGDIVKLGYGDTATKDTNIPVRVGYTLNGLYLGTTNLFVVEDRQTTGDFTISYKSVAGDYNPGGDANVSWSNPLVLTANYVAASLTTKISTRIKATSEVIKETTRKIANADGTIVTKTLTTNVSETTIVDSVTDYQQKYGANMLLPNDPVLEGYTFNKWIRTDATGNPYYVSSGGSYVECTVNSDTIVNFRNLYYYDSGDGTYKPAEFVGNETIYIKALYEKNAMVYTFSGNNEQGQRISLISVRPDNITSSDVVEFFNNNPYGYELTYNALSGTYSFKYFDSFKKALVTTTLPTINVLQGYDEGYWTVTTQIADNIYQEGEKTTDSTGTEYTPTTLLRTQNTTETVNFTDFGRLILSKDDSLTNVSVNITYKPKQVSVHYFVDNEQYSVSYVNYSQKFTLPSAPAKENKSFAGWRLVRLSVIDASTRTVQVGSETETIINSGSITLDDDSYMTIDEGTSASTSDDTYFVGFEAVYVDNTYKVKFNFANGQTSSYIQDGIGEYEYSVTNGQAFYELFLGTRDEKGDLTDRGLQAKILDKLGLDPATYAIVLKSQKDVDSSALNEFYCYSSYAGNQYSAKDLSEGATSNLEPTNTYSYSIYGSEFYVGIIYLAGGLQESDKLFTTSDVDVDDKTLTIAAVNGEKVAANDIFKKNLIIPMYIEQGGTGKDNLYKVTSLGAGFLYNNGNGISLFKDTIGTITLPDSIKTIKKGAFSKSADDTKPFSSDLYCPNLTSINYIGKTLTWTQLDLEDASSHPLYMVSEGNYYNTSGKYQTLKMTFIDNYSNKLVLPKTNTIKQYAFINMAYLTSITVPIVVSSFGTDCFKLYDDRDCTPTDSTIAIERYIPAVALATGSYDDYTIWRTNLTTVNYEGTVANWAHISFATKYSTPMSLTAYADDNRSTLPLADLKVNGQSLVNLDANALTVIKDYTFYCCGKLSVAVLSSNIQSIGKYAFSRTGISTISVPTSVSSIGEGGFAYCSNMSTITFTTALKSLERNVFVFYKLDAGAITEVTSTFTINFNGTDNDFTKITKTDANDKTKHWYGFARYNSASTKDQMIDFKIKYTNRDSELDVSSEGFDLRLVNELVDCLS